MQDSQDEDSNDFSSDENEWEDFRGEFENMLEIDYEDMDEDEEMSEQEESSDDEVDEQLPDEVEYQNHNYIGGILSGGYQEEHQAQQIDGKQSSTPTYNSTLNKACIIPIKFTIPMPGARIPYVTSEPTIVSLLLQMLGLRPPSEEGALLPCLIGLNIAVNDSNTDGIDIELRYGCTITVEKAHFDEVSYCLGVVFVCDKRCVVENYKATMYQPITGIVRILDDEFPEPSNPIPSALRIPQTSGLPYRMIPLLGKSAFMRDIPEEGECEQLAISILRTSNRFYANLDDADICRRLPSDLPSLSFFLAQQLVLDYKEEKLLWNCSSAIERVRKEKELCRESSEMCCQCGQQLTSFTSNERLNLFGGNSVKATFVNRYGNSFNIITTRQLSNYRCISPPSMEDTWFPNYSWRIIQCKKCRHHIGWLFSTQEDLHPRKFYGITLDAVKFLSIV